ncbi:MAG TPA: hypothetical protein VGW75_08010 [Solirubrobacteraceae bacterium]|jgi:hypothetical protein|nr:hypothetical protein [Solirubrobacteraceae bacterium]
MSPVDRPVPPPGEDIHIPGPSIQPLLIAVAVTTALLGITIAFPFLLIAGLVLLVSVIVSWVRGARREFEELPAEHRHH